MSSLDPLWTLDIHSNRESWADDLSDLVFETGENHMVVMMQPWYEEEDDSWLLNILLSEDKEVDEAEQRC